MHDIHILTQYPISDEDVVRLNLLRTTLNETYEAITSTVIEALTESGNNIIFVARVQGHIVGMVVLKRSCPHILRTGSITSFIVNEQHRCGGIGTQLLRRAVSVADQSGVTELTLRAGANRIEARRLYAKMGFKPCTCIEENFFRTHDRPKPG